MIISKIRIVMSADGKEEGKVYLQNKFGTAYDGHANTNLKAGLYQISSVDTVNKKWNIDGVTTGLKFYIITEGVDPWRLNYAKPLLLEITTDKLIESGNPNEVMLDGIGAAVYRDDPAYIDKVKAGHYDVTTGRFTVDHEDGSTIELDYRGLVSQVTGKSNGAVKMYVYIRNTRNGKIYPKFFDLNTTPNIAAMIIETEEARVDAEMFVQTVPFMFDLVSFSGFVKSAAAGLGNAVKKGLAPKADAPGKVWKAVPKGSSKAVLDYMQIIEDLPTANIGRHGDADLFTAAVRAKPIPNPGGPPKVEIFYEVKEMIALGPDAGKVKAAHRAMIVKAAEKAKLAGQREFRLVGKQSNANAIAHHDRLAQSIGIPGSGKSVPNPIGFADHEVTLIVEKVLGLNNP
jgi:hypothetical protein